MLTIFGFHTNDKLYTKHAKILESSAKKFGIDVKFNEFSKNDWQKIIAFKPTFIAQMRRELKGPILYIDADAIILKDIRPFFNAVKEDIAVHYINNNRLISSTLFINDTPNAHLLVNEWEKRMLTQPDRWDQIILQELVDEWVEAGKVTLNKLPPSYTFIFDTSLQTYGSSVEPIIEQVQASRDMRWIEKYNSRGKIQQWMMRVPNLRKSTRKVMKRHENVNNRMQQLGIDIRLTLDDLLD